MGESIDMISPINLSSSQKVVLVVGPTASGKSNWALEKAMQYGGSIINIDSIQVYQGLEVGAASPSAEELKKVPHYLYSYVQAPQEMTAGRYIQDFYNLIANQPIQFPVFIVGGTGFYVQALEKGMYDVEPTPAELRLKLEDELRLHGADVLFAELLQKDPQTQIHVNDHYRLVRALEIIRHTGKTPSEMKALSEKNKNPCPFPILKIGFSFEKSVFLKQVERRTEKMIQQGIIDETRFFIERDQLNWAPLSSVGFKETVDYLQTNKNLKWLQESIVQSTMQLIKKQKTWFKRDASILWSDHSEESRQRIDQKLDHYLLGD